MTGSASIQAQPPSSLSRRSLLRLFGLGAVGLLTVACGGENHGVHERPPGPGGPETDFSARFSAFEPADEPNGDLSKVVWPDFVTRAGPEVQRLYEFQIQNGELMRYMPCFCGCHLHDGHRNNRDCYVKAVNPDGSVGLDPMAPT
jgi:hypothetical protein